MAQTASMTQSKPRRIRARFEDADDVGFIPAAKDEVDGVIIDYLSDLGRQKATNRRILASSTRIQIETAGDKPLRFGAFVDRRGRLYYNGAGLAPQGKDFGRGCLRSAHAQRLRVSGLRHLLIGVATTWGEAGIDKAKMRARVAHVVEAVRDGRLASIVAGARNKTDYRWRLAEEPVQFIGLAEELIRAVSRASEGKRMSDHECAMFVGYDATCSGLQILAAVTGCPDTARLVNVLPREDGERADIYRTGADELNRICADMVANWSPEELAEAEAKAVRDGKDAGDHWALWWHRNPVKRGDTKQPVMVYCYGGKKRTFAGAFRETTKAPWQACLWLAAVLYDDVLATLLPRAHAFMEALQDVSRVLSKAGKPIRFTADDGLPFEQAVKKVEKDTLSCHTVNGRRLHLVVQTWLKELNPQKQATGIAPNIVHHWDGLFLRNAIRALAAAGIPFFTVHDCFYCRPGDWAEAGKIIRRVFVDTFSPDVAAELWRKIEEAANALPDADEGDGDAEAPTEGATPPAARVSLPPCPARGPLDVSAALRSEFLFS